MITSYDKTKDEVLKCYDDFLEIVRQSGFPDRIVFLLRWRSRRTR